MNSQEQMTYDERNWLITQIPILKYENPQKQESFFKRINWWLSKKPIIFRGNLQNKRRAKLLVAASAVLLTKELRNYKFKRSVRKIILYPNSYYSILNRKNHFGEYNRKMKLVVLSEQKLKDGFADASDGLHLGLHEFAHALFFETYGKNSWEALRFQWGFKKIKTLLDTKTLDSVEVRSYAQANVHEYFSALVELLFEKGEYLQNKHPELYGLLGRMLNHRGHCPNKVYP